MDGKYIYCIIADKKPKSFGPFGVGGRNDEVRAICFEDIAAVVSDSPIITYTVSRQNTLAHEKAIEEVMKDYTVLPVRFGTVAENDGEVKKILEREYDKFKNLLNSLEGKKELGLKAIFEEKVIYGEILEKYKDVKALKEKIEDMPPSKTYYQRMEIGKMVETALQKEKEFCKKDILNVLSPLAVEVKTNNTYGDHMILNAAFLVEKFNEAAFDKKVNALDAKYREKIRFKYVGTLPPFNFVNLVIKTGEC